MPTIAEPAPNYVEHLGDNEYVIGGSKVSKQFRKKAIYIKSNTVADINAGISRALLEAQNNHDKQYLATPIGLRNGDNSQKDIALLFEPLLFLPNVRLPKNYIWEIVNKAHYDSSFESHFTADQRSALRQKWYDLNKDIIRENYSNLFGIFDEEKMNFSNELVDLITSSEAGICDNGDSLNQIRCVLECVFERMIQMQLLSEKCRGSNSECGKSIQDNKKIPAYIRNYIYAIIGVVNSGSHAWLSSNNLQCNREANNEQNQSFIRYRNAVNSGELPYLTRSLVFMLLCVIDWCVGEMRNKGMVLEVSF